MVERTIDATDELTEDELLAWLRSLNDVRLVLGTILDVSEEDATRMPIPTPPRPRGVRVPRRFSSGWS